MSKNWSAKYYEDNKERLQKNLEKEEKRRKRKKQQYDGERYKNLPEDLKKSLLSIEKNIL